jgi:hypothetical protein
MNTRSISRAALRGNMLVITLVVIGLVGLAIVSYLTLVSHQTKVTARGQTWNSCLAVAEAGVEDALAHLNKNGVGKPKLDAGEWSRKRDPATGVDVYTVQRSFNDGYYVVSIRPGVRPVITSTGFLPAPLAYATARDGKTTPVYLSRTITVNCRTVGRYTKAIVAKNKINLNGKYVKVDSFNSYDTNLSAWTTNGWGVYDTNKISDHGDIAVIDGLSDTLNLGNAQVWGKVSTGPDGNLKTNKNVVVGDVAFHQSGVKGVQDGWSSEDANFDMPSVTPPFTSGFTPAGGWVGTNYYDYILNNGDYVLNQKLQGLVLVTGNARLLARQDIVFKDGSNDDDGIEFAPGARLELYCDSKNAKLTGKKDKKNKPLSDRTAFNSGGNATNFMFFGTDKLDVLNLSKSDEFCGIIYAPNTKITLKAGSVKYYRCHVNGSIIGYDVTLEKNANVHYDENIANLDADSYVVESWAESGSAGELKL